jgi:tRNA nucleotidyltransferase (CCA-adding enzyme)
MSFADAALRRDFTINAMGIDLRTGALHDPHGGQRDLSTRTLRHVSAAFDEDPLRVLRGAQFCARFLLRMHDDTIARCLSLQSELSTLPAERIGEEMKKLLVSGVWPSLGLHVLRATGALVLFPELHALIDCPQEPEWHPEGDVWTHTLMVTDEAARLTRDMDIDVRERVVWGALCHDLGKPQTTVQQDGRWRSLDHEAQGEAPTRALLSRCGLPLATIDVVTALVKDHLKPFHFWRERDRMSDGALRRLALRVPLKELALVAASDAFGRTTPDALAREDDATPWLLAQAERLAIQDAAPKPLLLGRHLQMHGLSPGKAFGVLLKEAFEAQLDGVFVDEGTALDWLKSRLSA